MARERGPAGGGHFEDHAVIGRELPMIGQTISHYKILEKLGEGGMGVVYKAQDLKLDRFVALKFLPRNLTANEAEKARFLQEAKAAALLNHPNICTIYAIEEFESDASAGGNGKELFIAMEYVEGDTIRKQLLTQNPKLETTLSYALQIGDALQEAHSKGIVHRDVKADNIMVNSKNQIKVMDFGLAKLKGSLKLTRTSSTVGTLAYMAPEQIQGGEVDARSDIFAFGVLLFEMLTRKLPFRGEHDAAMMYSIVNEEPESVFSYLPGLSPELDRIIRRALEKDPEDRYQSVADMVSELRRQQKKSSRVVRPSGGSAAAVSAPVAGDRGVELNVSFTKRKAFLFGLPAVLCAAAALTFFILRGREQAIDSLAVLPFENVGANPEEEYLSDGVTESVINNLTKISTLRVVPRSTVFRFKGKEMDVQDIGSKLNVAAVLSGRITHRGPELDVQVDLIDIKKESEVWGNHYQSSPSDILSLQQQITNDVSSKLGIGLSTETREKLVQQSTENTRAYQLYLQGRYYWNKRNGPELERAINYFQQAIALDSNFALAYVGLADTYLIQPQYSGTPTRVARPLAHDAARRALGLDNSLAEAHTTLAFCYFDEWNYGDAEREFKKSIALNPRYATTYHWYNILLTRTGRLEEASPIIQRAYELDPYSAIITLNMGALAFLSSRYEDALKYFEKSTEIDPSFAAGYAWSGLVYEQTHKYNDALPLMKKAVELSGRSGENISYLGHLFGKLGRTSEALKLAREAEERYKAGTSAAYNVARIYVGLDDREKALDWLEQDVRDQSTFATNLKMDPAWDEIRTEPRFMALLKTVGLGK